MRTLPVSSEVRARVASRARSLRLVRPQRRHLAAARLLAERKVMALAPRRPSQRDRILCYHAVGTPSWGVNDVRPARLRRQLEQAKACGYRFVPAEQLASGLVAGDPARPFGRGVPSSDGPRLAVTFDDGLASVATHAAPLLRDMGVPWSLFVVGEWAEHADDVAPGTFLGWDQITSLAEGGVVIGSHSLSHRDFATLSQEETERELTGSRRLIEQRTGIEVHDFAIPFGQSSNWNGSATEAARRAGYRWIYAQSELRRPVGTVARSFVTRFDDDRTFDALLAGAFDGWEEWL